MSLVRGLVLARLCEVVSRAGTITISSGSGLMKTIGQDRTAVREWSQAAEADFRNAEAGGLEPLLRQSLYLARGKLRLQTDRLAAAEDDFTAAIAIEKNRALLHVLRAESLRRLGRLPEAITEINRAVTLEPKDAGYLRARAELRQPDKDDASRDQVELAIADLESAGRLESRPAEAAAIHVKRARLLAKLKRQAAAMEAVEAALTAEPRRVEAHLLKVATLLELGKYDELKAACDAALVLPCPSASAAQLHRLRGLALVGKGQFHEGILDFTRALDVEPTSFELRIDRGWAYLMARATVQACRDFDEAIRIAGGRAQGYSGRAAVRVEQSDLAGAVDDVQTALKLDPSSPQVLYNAARVYARAASLNGRSRSLERRAQEALREAFRQTPPERQERFREALLKDPIMQPLLNGHPALLSAVGLARTERP